MLSAPSRPTARMPAQRARAHIITQGRNNLLFRPLSHVYISRLANPPGVMRPNNSLPRALTQRMRGHTIKQKRSNLRFHRLSQYRVTSRCTRRRVEQLLVAELLRVRPTDTPPFKNSRLVPPNPIDFQSVLSRTYTCTRAIAL